MIPPPTRHAALLGLCLACAAWGALAANAADPPTRAALSSGDAKQRTGLASVYSDQLSGQRTASGQAYDRNGLTAASKTLPLGSRIKVTNRKNGRSVVLRIKDRGPAQADRILDITPRAAHALGLHETGVAMVSYEVLAAR